MTTESWEYSETGPPPPYSICVRDVNVRTTRVKRTKDLDPPPSYDQLQHSAFGQVASNTDPSEQVCVVTVPRLDRSARGSRPITAKGRSIVTQERSKTKLGPGFTCLLIFSCFTGLICCTVCGCFALSFTAVGMTLHQERKKSSKKVIAGAIICNIMALALITCVIVGTVDSNSQTEGNSEVEIGSGSGLK